MTKSTLRRKCLFKFIFQGLGHNSSKQGCETAGHSVSTAMKQGEMNDDVYLTLSF